MNQTTLPKSKLSDLTLHGCKQPFSNIPKRWSPSFSLRPSGQGAPHSPKDNSDVRKAFRLHEAVLLCPLWPLPAFPGSSYWIPQGSVPGTDCCLLDALARPPGQPLETASLFVLLSPTPIWPAPLPVPPFGHQPEHAPNQVLAFCLTSDVSSLGTCLYCPRGSSPHHHCSLPITNSVKANPELPLKTSRLPSVNKTATVYALALVSCSPNSYHPSNLRSHLISSESLPWVTI